MTEVALIDSGVDMNCIQEWLIPLKYYEKSTERLTQANGEKLIINYKLPNVHICNDGLCFETIFKDLSSEVILRNPFMTLLYPFFMIDGGIKINVLVLRFTSPLISKEIRSLNKVTILKDINKERICRTERHLLSLKTEKSLVNQLIDNVINKFKLDIKIEIYSYSPTAFLHRHQHIVQTPCEKEFSGKNIQDGIMLTISFSQYEWTNGLTDIRSKFVINNVLILFTIISNIHTK